MGNVGNGCRAGNKWVLDVLQEFRSFRFVIFVTAQAVGHWGLAIGAPTTAPAERDWVSHPALVQIDDAQEVLALGDVHGDYEKLVKLLVGTRVIKGAPQTPTSVQWSAGKAVLVCTGDMINKWDRGLEVLQLMRALQISAQAVGGQVVVALGNHEAEFLAAGSAGSKSAEFDNELREKGIRPQDLAAGLDSDGLGQWLRDCPIAVKVGDWFFCHAGNTHGLTMMELETAIERGVSSDGFGAFVLSQPNSILEARMHPVPWWIAVDTTVDTAEKLSGLERLRAYATALGCKHVVVGHQPGAVKLAANVERNAGEPFAYEGVLFLIDTGMSRGVQDGRGILLKIHVGSPESATALDASGAASLLWSEK